MRVLLTGCTSTQCNPVAHTRVGNYSGYLAQALRELGHRVDHQDPGFGHDLEPYDLVVVGLAPLGSIGANRTYGALDVISRLLGDPRLRLLVDAPEPEKIETSLVHLGTDRDRLFKRFFSTRLDYAVASSAAHRERLHQAVDYLANDTWPVTVVPSLPWTVTPALEARLTLGARGQVRPLSVDPWVFEASDTWVFPSERPMYWSYEPSSWARWLELQHVSWSVVKVPRSHRVESDTAALRVLRESQGCLIAPDKRGLWWNTRFAQALSQRAPVFTEWEEAQHLSSAFSVLAANYEYAPAPLLAEAQRAAYERPKEEALAALEKIVRT